jgi:hypothetical protein
VLFYIWYAIKPILRVSINQSKIELRKNIKRRRLGIVALLLSWNLYPGSFVVVTTPRREGKAGILLGINNNNSNRTVITTPPETDAVTSTISSFSGYWSTSTIWNGTNVPQQQQQHQLRPFWTGGIRNGQHPRQTAATMVDPSKNPGHNPHILTSAILLMEDEQTNLLKTDAFSSSLGVVPDVINRPSAPTHHACDHSRGIYHIAMGDIGGAAGTIFFQFVLGQAIYAERHNLKPWVFLNNVSYIIYDPVVHGQGPGVNVTAFVGRNATYIHRRDGHWRDTYPGPPNETAPVIQRTQHFAGTGVWEHYFEPISDYMPGDKSCESKLYVTMDLYLITPGIHGFASWAPRCWKYKYLPDYISQPHIPITEWLAPQRRLGHAAAVKYIRFRPYLQRAAYRANPDCRIPDQACLGIHIRHSDKAAGRRVVETKEFLPYVQAFVGAGGQHVYLATDSRLVIQEMQNTWPQYITSRIRRLDNIVRSGSDQAVFDLGYSRHRINEEVLIEILALAQCQFLIHGLSAVSESSIWLNLDLHNQSVNLEDDERISPEDFATLVPMVMHGQDPSLWPRPWSTIPWWDNGRQHASSVERDTKERAGYTCNSQEHRGVLWISSVGTGYVMTAGAFFTSIINQLIYAERNNLEAWVHLVPESASLIYDAAVHSEGEKRSFVMMSGLFVRNHTNEFSSGRVYPGELSLGDSALKPMSYQIQGNGIWDSYFEPVSDFRPGDPSCRDLPLVQMASPLVAPGLNSYSPWAVRAWRYDDVPNANWIAARNTSLQAL